MNKLIVLLDMKGNYKGGAQRRYLNLFSHLQKQHDGYYLLINNILYRSLINDQILRDETNVIHIKVKHEKNTGNNKQFSYRGGSKKKNEKGIRRYIGRNKMFLRYLQSWFGFNISLYRIIRKYKIDSIYGVFTGGMWSCLLSRIIGIYFVYSYNDSGCKTVSKKFRDIFNSEYWPVRYADKVDFLSEQVLRNYQDKVGTIKKDKISICPNSFIDYTRFEPVYPKKNIITYSSRIIPIKNPDLMVEAAYELSLRKIDDYEILIIGEGRMLDEIKRKAKDYGLNNLKIIGPVKYPEQYLSVSKIFISIQKDNNYPSQSLLEAMACENAIIASDVGETRKLVTEKEGILVALEAKEIANAMEYLIKTPAELEKKGKNARIKATGEHSREKFLEYFYTITQKPA